MEVEHELGEEVIYWKRTEAEGGERGGMEVVEERQRRNVVGEGGINLAEALSILQS